MQYEPNEQEKSYLAKVKQILGKDSGPVEVVDALAAIELPAKDDLSLNTLNIINSIDALNSEREDGDLEGGVSGNEAYDNAEKEIAAGILDHVNRILADIENNNWYMYKYSVDFVYSQLKDGAYSYRSTTQSIDAASREEADRQKEAMKKTVPKSYPNEPEFTLEDVRVSGQLVDARGNPVS